MSHPEYVCLEPREIDFDKDPIFWFHTVDKDGVIIYQGCAIEFDGPYILGQLFEWGFGEATDFVRLDNRKISSLRFYTTSEEMKDAYRLFKNSAS
ncbi:hypothetical protein [Chromobacterium haemolyticum]|uniref:hypothetical protein n=1 Tax=Chromobacterium haemolyticum TaxID=394935 RepID=UPI001178638D|nr:hypothetical protein [Chromobacterium haemolyticum]